MTAHSDLSTKQNRHEEIHERLVSMTSLVPQEERWFVTGRIAEFFRHAPYDISYLMQENEKLNIRITTLEESLRGMVEAACDCDGYECPSSLGKTVKIAKEALASRSSND